MIRLLIVSAALGCTLGAQTPAPRIAVVDVTAVFKAHPETAKAEAALEKHRREARAEADRKSKKLKELLTQHQEITHQLVAAGSNPPASLKDKATGLLDEASSLERELAAMRTTQERDLKQEFLRERRKILDDITRHIEALNADGSFALVLDRSAASANGIPQVLHSPGAEDITDQLISRLRKPAAAAKPPSPR